MSWLAPPAMRGTLTSRALYTLSEAHRSRNIRANSCNGQPVKVSCDFEKAADFAFFREQVLISSRASHTHQSSGIAQVSSRGMEAGERARVYRDLPGKENAPCPPHRRTRTRLHSRRSLLFPSCTFAFFSLTTMPTRAQ